MRARFLGLLTPGNAAAVAVGIMLMISGNFLFAASDALGKFLVAGMSVGQVVAIRAVGAFILLAPAAAGQKKKPFRNVERPWAQVLRVIFITLDTLLFYAAIVYLPLADVFTFYMAGPIYVAVLSHFFLGERVGWQRWAAILVGFSGVIVALGPSSASLSMGALLALAGSLSCAFWLVLSKVLQSTSDTTLGIYQATGMLIGGGALAVFGWVDPTPVEWMLLLLLGVIGGLAHLTITRAMKLAPVSLLAPFQYTLLIWGIVLGYIFFDDVPAPRIIIGACIIVLAGLFIVRRKARLNEPIKPDDLPSSAP